MEGSSKLVLLSLLAALILDQASGSCFGKDANWEVNAKPTVTQPSKRDPEKVMVTWGNIIKNVKCVDKFFVWVWPDGTQKTERTARRIQVDKTKTSHIVQLEPCIGYRFALESEEDDMRKNFHSTSDVLFKTSAVASLVSLDRTRFSVGYHWDPVRHVSDLKLASIKFPKSLIKNVNCLDYIQVTGVEVRGRGSSTRHSSPASMTGRVAWAHLATPPARGGAPPRGPLANTYSSSSSSGYNQGSSSSFSSSSGFNQGSSSSSGYNQGSSSSSSSGYNQGSSMSSLPVGNSPFGPIETPAYANTLPRATSKGAAKHVGPVKVQPPFLGDTVELLVTAPDCAEFNFEVKVFAPTSKQIGQTEVHLPALADIPSYVPPPVTEVMAISFKGGKPVYGVKTSSGVSAACLPAYFEASDAYRQRLENEIGFFAGKTDTVNTQVSQTAGKSDQLDQQTLKLHGCVCDSPNLSFSSTDAKIEKEHPQFFGTYSYKAMHDSHPSYEKAAAPGTKAMFLFFDKKKGRWMFGPSLGSSKGVEYGSGEFSTAKCPADPASAGTWMRKSSILHRWKKNASLKLVCMK